MADIVSREKRSQMMSGIRGKDTGIEKKLRHELHRRGFRYRLHDRLLPGRPDLVLPKYNAVVQVNGCFWHGHDCGLFKSPASNAAFWEDKIQKNRERDERNRILLGQMGWRVLEVWECSMRGKKSLGTEKTADLADDWLRSDGIFMAIRSPRNRSNSGSEVNVD